MNLKSLVSNILILLLFFSLPVVEVKASTKKCRPYFERIENFFIPGEWKISADKEREFLELFSRPNLTDEEKLLSLLKSLIEAKIEKRNPLAKYLIRQATKSSLYNDSIYSYTIGKMLGRINGPHYHPLANRIVNSSNPNMHIIDRIIIAVHETDHAIERNVHPWSYALISKGMVYDIFNAVLRTPVEPLGRYYLETRAIGAQWELARRIPAEVREELIRELKESGIESVQRITQMQKKYINLFGLDLDQSDPIFRYLAGETYHWEKLSKLSDSDYLKKEDEVLYALLKYDYGITNEEIASWPFNRELIQQLKTIYGLPSVVFSKSESLIKNLVKEGKETEAAIQKEKNQKPTYGIRQITLSTLQNVNLPKDEFIKLMAEKVHGYDLKNLLLEHYDPRRSTWRIVLIGLSVIAIGMYVYDKEKKEKPLIPAQDINLIFQILMSLLAEETNS